MRLFESFRRLKPSVIVLSISLVALLIGVRIIAGYLSPDLALVVDLDVRPGADPSAQSRGDRIEVFINSDVTAPRVAPIQTGEHLYRFNAIPANLQALRVDPTIFQDTVFRFQSITLVTPSLSLFGNDTRLVTFPVGEPGADMKADSDPGFFIATSNDPAVFFSPDVDLRALVTQHANFFGGSTLLIMILGFGGTAASLLYFIITAIRGITDPARRRLVTAIASFGVLTVVNIACFGATNVYGSLFRPQNPADGQTIKELQKQLSEFRYFEALTPDEANIDVRSRLQSKDKKALIEKREELRKLIFPSGRENSPPSVADLGPVQSCAATAANSVTRLRVTMDLQMTSDVDYYHTVRPNGCLLLYHDGHSFDRSGKCPYPVEAFEPFLQRGCDVLAFSMPLNGNNPSPVHVTLNSGEEFTLSKHDDFFALAKAGYPALKFFIQPVIAVLDYISKQPTRYSKIGMTGVSGGGWTTIVAGALDPRLKYLFPVAGMFPLYLSNSHPTCSPPDFEQASLPGIAKLTYFDFYLLGVADKDRSALYVFNKYDPGCYPGVKVYGFDAQLRSIAKDWNLGDLAFFVDDTHTGHGYSDESLRRIAARFLDAR